MSRPRKFDEGTALEAAIDCFWQRGYEASSIRDLAARMGISEPSLYNAFGDKHELFTRALERYLDASRARIETFETSLAPREALRRFFEDLIERSVNDKERRGCFLINSALEIAPHDAALGAVIAARLDETEAFFLRTIKRAQADGTAPAERNAQDIARLFLAALLGIRVLARAKPDRALLEGIARPALSLLDPPPTRGN
jgi:TetR/AcrR family transcriptional repressor of nem operon